MTRQQRRQVREKRQTLENPRRPQRSGKNVAFCQQGKLESVGKGRRYHSRRTIAEKPSPLSLLELSMTKRVSLLALLALAFVAASSSAQAGLLDRMLGHHGHGHGCCEPTCGCEAACEPTCGCEAACEPTCGCEAACEPSCGCEASCGCEPACGCDSCCDSGCGFHLPKLNLLSKLRGLFHCGGCCDSCCEPACEPACGCEPSCGCGH